MTQRMNKLILLHQDRWQEMQHESEIARLSTPKEDECNINPFWA